MSPSTEHFPALRPSTEGALQSLRNAHRIYLPVHTQIPGFCEFSVKSVESERLMPGRKEPIAWQQKLCLLFG